MQKCILTQDELGEIRLPAAESKHNTPDYGVVILDDSNEAKYFIYTDLISQKVMVRGIFGDTFSTISIDFLKSQFHKTFTNLYRDIISYIAKDIENNYSQIGKSINVYSYVLHLIDLPDNIIL